MAITKAAKSVTIKFIPKMGTLSAYIVSTGGDLFQFYNSTEGTFSPNYTPASPLNLRLAVRSSSSTQEVPVKAISRVLVGGSEVRFGTNQVSTGTYVGVFERGINNVKVIGNFADKLGYASSVLTIEGEVDNGGRRESISASLPMRVMQGTGSETLMTITAHKSATDTTAGDLVLTQDNVSVTLVPMVFVEGTAGSLETLKQTYTFRWYRASGGGWTEITATGNGFTLSGDKTKLTVSRDGVNAYLGIRCEMHKKSGTPTFVCGDIIGVHDVADEYDIDPCPNLIDQTIEDGVSGKESLTYTPKLVKRTGDTWTEEEVANGFNFDVQDSAGNTITDQTSAANPKPLLKALGKKSLTITADHLRGVGDVELYIEC